TRSVRAALEDLLSERAAEPGLAVSAIRGPDVVARHWRGLASLEHAVPIHAGTRFHIVSVGKTFTAAALPVPPPRGALARARRADARRSGSPSHSGIAGSDHGDAPSALVDDERPQGRARAGAPARCLGYVAVPAARSARPCLPADGRERSSGRTVHVRQRQ